MKKIIIPVLVVLFVIMYIEVFGNFYKITNDVYRSGQLNNLNMAYYLKTYNIKTVLNLRGKSTKDYYKDEKRITKENNVDLVNFKMSSGKFYDFNQTSTLVELIKNAKKPLLIHCIGGADRTSLASALYQYAILNSSVEKAKEEFSWYYGHLPIIRPHVLNMDKSFDNYVNKSTKQNL